MVYWNFIFIYLFQILKNNYVFCHYKFILQISWKFFSFIEQKLVIKRASAGASSSDFTSSTPATDSVTFSNNWSGTSSDAKNDQSVIVEHVDRVLHISRPKSTEDRLYIIRSHVITSSGYFHYAHHTLMTRQV